MRIFHRSWWACVNQPMFHKMHAYRVPNMPGHLIVRCDCGYARGGPHLVRVEDL